MPGRSRTAAPATPRSSARTFDWKELLDLLEEIGGSEQAAALFERHVVGATERGAVRRAGRGPRALRRRSSSRRRVVGPHRRPTRDDELAVRSRRLLHRRGAGHPRDEGGAARPRRRPRRRPRSSRSQDTYESGTDLDEVADVAEDAVETARGPRCRRGQGRGRCRSDRCDRAAVQRRRRRARRRAAGLRRWRLRGSSVSGRRRRETSSTGRWAPPCSGWRASWR